MLAKPIIMLMMMSGISPSSDVGATAVLMSQKDKALTTITAVIAKIFILFFCAIFYSHYINLGGIEKRQWQFWKTFAIMIGVSKAGL